MDIQGVAAVVGMSTGTLSLILQGYTTLFQRTNVEQFVEMLITSGKKLEQIGNREELQRHFLAVVQKVSMEANAEKIRAWKNAVSHMATDFSEWPYLDNFFAVLDHLTVFDLVVLHQIYRCKEEPNSGSTVESPADKVQKTILYFVGKGVPVGIAKQSMNRLFSNGLVDESSTWDQFLAGRPNELGVQFLKFVED